MSSHTRRKTTRYTSSIPIDRNGRSYAYGFEYTPSSASSVTRGGEAEYINRFTQYRYVCCIRTRCNGIW